MQPMIDYTLPLEQLPDPLPIMPLERPFDVTITPPGSKSITCRAYVLAALAEGTSRIIRPLRADDTDTLLKALCTLGAKAEWAPGSPERAGDDYPDDVLITGVGGRFPRGGDLFMGEGGAPTRFMIACACLAKEPVTIDASPRMRERPIAEGVEMLRSLGAKIEYVEEEGRLPVRVVPTPGIKGGTLKVGKTASSQFVSAVMLIAPFCAHSMILHCTESQTSEAYVSLTKETLNACGFTTTSGDDVRSSWIRIHAGRTRFARCFEYAVEPDASAAVYFVEACVLVPGSAIVIPQLPWRSNQPDTHAIDLLSREECVEPVIDWHEIEWGDVRLRPKQFAAPCPGLSIRATTFPDGALAIATAAATATSPSTLTGLSTLRHKETDRLAALATELRKVGCEVETGEDWIRITPIKGTPALRAGRNPRDSESRGSSDPRDSESRGTFDSPGSESRGTSIIETYNDHRMAMAFAVLGLARPGISIRNPRCVAKSYPTFWKDFAKLYGQSRADQSRAR